MLLQDGFGKDVLILWLVSVLLISGLALAGSRAADLYLGRTVNETLGSTGSYDAILHVRSEAAEAGLSQAEALLRRTYPGVGLHRGVEVAGNASLFVALPDASRNRAGLEGLPGLLQMVPGYNGVTYMVEPSIELANIASGLERDLLDRVEQVPGVAFAFGHGTTVTAVLEGPEHVRAVSEELEHLAEDQSLVELYLPQAFAADPQELGDRLSARTGLALQPVGWGDGPSPELAGGLDGLDRLLPLLQEGSGMKAAWLETSRQLRELGETVARAQESARAAAAAGTERAAELQAALHQVAGLQARVDQLAEELAGPSGRGSTLDLLARLVLERLGGATARARSEEPDPGSAPSDVEGDAIAVMDGLNVEALTGLQAQLDGLSASLEAMDPTALEQAAAELETTAGGLPSFTAGQVEELRSVLAAWAGQAPGEAGRLLFLVDGEVDGPALTGTVRSELGDEAATVSVLPVATVRPTARASLMQILHQARGLVAAILVVILAAAHLLLDLSALRSGSAALARLRPAGPTGPETGAGRPLWRRLVRRVRRLDVTWPLAAAWGAVTLVAACALAGAEPPYLNGGSVALLGALLAWAAWALAGRINPVRVEEVELAVAAGLTPAQVMRAVVLPEARPSLLSLLARRGRLLHGPGAPGPRRWWAARHGRRQGGGVTCGGGR